MFSSNKPPVSTLSPIVQADLSKAIIDAKKSGDKDIRQKMINFINNSLSPMLEKAKGAAISTGLYAASTGATFAANALKNRGGKKYTKKNKKSRKHRKTRRH